MCTYTNASKFFFFNFRALTFCNHCCNLNFGYAAACWLKLTWTRVVHLYAICAEDLQPISKTKSIQNKNNNNKSKHFNNQRTASVCIARVSNSNLNFSHTRTHTCTLGRMVQQLQRVCVGSCRGVSWQQCMALERHGAKAQDWRLHCCHLFKLFNISLLLQLLLRFVVVVFVVLLWLQATTVELHLHFFA